MKIRILKRRSAAIFVASLVAVCGLAQKKPDDAAPDEGPCLTVMNPAVENKIEERLPLPPRLDMLQGKTVYLIDINWGGPIAALLKDTHGFKTKRSRSEWLSQNVEKTAASYWGNAVVASLSAALALQGLEPYVIWRQLPCRFLDQAI
jgi:hypothetical protein